MAVVEFLDLLRCPATHESLTVTEGRGLENESRSHCYAVSEAGIPFFAETSSSADSQAQQSHYENVASAYLKNLSYPHTREYVGYMDRKLLDAASVENSGDVVEICCGSGEALQKLSDRIRRGIGVDISEQMLQAARRRLPDDRFLFVQGDAVSLPLASNRFDNAFILGGIHHVNDRVGLFSEAFRILKPQGRLFWIEPVNDFVLWRALRSIIYRLSPMLDHDTERPLRYNETAEALTEAGFRLERWDTFGLSAFCLFMNSDVLIFNRAFQYVPGIPAMVRLMIRIDEWMARLPGMSRSGLLVLGTALRPS